MGDRPAQRYPALYAAFEEQYRRKGVIPVPVGDNKAPLGQGWASLSPTQGTFAERLRRNADANIGVLAGTPVGTDYVFAFIDCDDDRLVALIAAFLGITVCAKVGLKGITHFVRAPRGMKSFKLSGPGKRPVLEFMINSGMTVLPPSMHPSGQRYRWIDNSLLDIDLHELPTLDANKVAILKKLVKDVSFWAIIEGGSDVKAHDLMLKLTSCGIASMTEDFEWLEHCLAALFHPEYRGDTKKQIGEMLRSAAQKGLGTSRAVKPYNPGEQGPLPLGYARDGAYALLDQNRQLIMLASAQQLLSGQYLVGLASSSFWASQFKSEKGFNSHAAGEAILAACRLKGPFDPKKVRGRGVWLEGERVVINLGAPVSSAENLYLCFEPIKLSAAPSFDARRLLTLLRRFTFRNPKEAYLLFGWLALAPICGVLRWRPHLFVYGPPKSGKTTIHSIANALLRPLVLSADGQSSEAGIRQTIGPDSLPVMLDEFESDQNGTGLRQVLRLARSASSADTPVLKGTPEGKAMTFSLRAAFFFAAVNPRGMSEADQSRIVMIELLRHDNDTTTAKTIASEEAFFRGQIGAWCAYMVSHADKLGPAIDRLEPLVASSDRRHRQNVSTLLGAGFVALNGRVPTDEEARALAAEFEGTVQQQAEDNERDDAQECLDHLFTYAIERFPLGDWLAAERDRCNGEMDDAHCERVVTSMGIRIKVDGDEPGVFLHRGSAALERVFRDTRWAERAWMTALRKLPEAFTPKHPVQSLTGKKRAIGLPLECLPEESLRSRADKASEY